jgi:hypothetical protein
MMKTSVCAILVGLLNLTALNVQAAEVCKVSMMGRVCFEEGSEAATSAHMKGDAVAEANTKKTIDKKVADDKKIATK